jgi:hypothetical protein
MVSAMKPVRFSDLAGGFRTPPGAAFLDVLREAGFDG